MSTGTTVAVRHRAGLLQRVPAVQPGAGDAVHRRRSSIAFIFVGRFALQPGAEHLDVRRADHHLHRAVDGRDDARLRHPPRLVRRRRAAGVQPPPARRPLLVHTTAGTGAACRPGCSARRSACCFTNIPGQFVGPLGNLAGGVDISLPLSLGVAAVLYLALLWLFPEPRAVHGPAGPFLTRAVAAPVAPITGER